MKLRRYLIAWWVWLWALAGCGGTAVEHTAVPDTDAEVTLTIFAASSLTDAFTELGQLFSQPQPGVTVQFNFAGSSDLAIQLAEGASADLFASANKKQMDNAINAGRIAGEPINFLTNSLVIIVPADNPAAIQTLADLAHPGIKFVSALPDVPIRGFTEEMLANAAADPAYGAEFATAVLSNLVSEEANVRQLAAKIALGEADAGVVYKSDVPPAMSTSPAEQVQVVVIPENLNIVAIYPLAIVQDAPNQELAQAFIELVLSAEGQAVLAKWGFGPRPTP